MSDDWHRQGKSHAQAEFNTALTQVSFLRI